VRLRSFLDQQPRNDLVVLRVDVLHERATEPALMAIPMIVVTANGSRQVIDGLQDKQVYAVVAKPFDLDVLVSTVTACLAHPHSPVLAAA
jgi:CheY-like chemotaxis protein